MRVSYSAWVVPALGAFALGACRLPYRPLTPHAASVGGTSASVTKIAVARVPMFQVVTDVRFASGRAPALGGAWLTADGSPRCSSGVPAMSNTRDPWLADPAARELAFDGAAVEAAGLMTRSPTVLDVEVLPMALTDQRLCLRVPATQARSEPEWGARTRWFLGTGIRVIAPVAGAHDDFGNGYVFDVHGGVWLGPARVRVDGEFGVTSSQHPAPAGYGLTTAELLGVAASVEWFPLRAGTFGIGGAVGYEWLWTDFHAQQGVTSWDEYAAGPRGPRAALRIARVPLAPTWPGFSNRKDGFAIGLDLSVARWTAPGALAATFVGIGFDADTGYWW